MKKIIRDTLLIVILFAAVLAAPFVIDNFSPDTPEKQEEKAAEQQAQQEDDRPDETPAARNGLPPQPVPADMRQEPAPARSQPQPRSGLCGTLDDVPSGPARIDGGAGVDTFAQTAGGRVDIDGRVLRSIERLNVRNNAANEVNVFASGLATMEDRALYVEGDPGLDTVSLDACLTWNEAGTDPDGNAVFNGEDSRGNRATVTLSLGLTILR